MSKLYKKTYRAGEKIYRLIVSENIIRGRFVIKIVENTIKSIHGNTWMIGNRFHIQTKHDNYGYGNYVYASEIAPRTAKGRSFLKLKAKNILKARINSLIGEQKFYQNLMESL